MHSIRVINNLEMVCAAYIGTHTQVLCKVYAIV